MNRTLTQALGGEITDLRVKANMSQDQLAFRLGYDETYMRKLERGAANPSLHLLASVADLFQIPLSVLIANAELRARNASANSALPH